MDNETTLEVILVNQNQKADETINALETIISQNENNKVDDILEAQLVTLDNIDKKIENTKLELEIDGAEVISIKGDTGEKGDKGDKGDTGANGKDGKDGVDGKDGADGKDGINGVDGISPNVDDITRDILETIVPKIPTAEELMSLVTMPKDGKDGKNGKNGKDGKDIDPKKIKDFEDNLSKIHSIASKTVSLVELDDVNLSGLTQTNGKYNLGSGGGGGAVDSVNGQTGVVVLGTADIADSSNKRYVTDAQLVVIGNTSGTNTGDNATNSQYSGLAASKVNITDTIVSNEFLSGQSFPNAIIGNAGSGDVDIYTCPSGKKAIVNLCNLHNTAGTTTTYFFQLKVSSVYYRLTTNSTITTNSDAVLQSFSLVLNAGESFSINTSQAGLNIFPNIVEFSDTAKTKTVKILSVASGDNTIYTCPSGKTGFILTAGLLRVNTSSVFYVNTSGSTATFSLHISSNTSSSSANRIRSSTLATATFNGFAFSQIIPDGYSVILNTNQTGGHAWLSVIEI